jgi:hypothetical protein
MAKFTNSHGGIENWNRRFHINNAKSHFDGLDAQRGVTRCRHLLADLVHRSYVAGRGTSDGSILEILSGS